LLAGTALLVACGDVLAGEIAGLRPQLPAFLQRDLDVTFINDFLGRGGSTDDFRTQQSIISATLTGPWIATLDHSILTVTDESSPGRIDQLSISLGYELANLQSDTRADRLVVGTGLRNVGKFSGEQIQNGLHKLVGSTIEELAYTGSSANDMTAWFDAERYRMIRDATDKGLFKTWRMGYQLRAASLISTGGEWDNAVSLQAVISKPAVDIWLGVRGDWRDGYEDAVLRATASAEEDVAIVLGARFGPLVIETVQQLNNNASYGQLRFVSSSEASHSYKRPDIGLDFSVLLPDVQIRLAGRLPSRILTHETSRWNESIVIGLQYGEPQYKDDTSLFTRSRQVDTSIEFERPLIAHSGWLTAYTALGAGWRDEKLTGAGDLQGESSEAIGRIVLTASAGLRFDLSSVEDRWRFRVQFGLLGRLPVDDAAVEIAGGTYQIQRNALELVVGAAVDFK
jgi:hypothetical protein